MVDRGEPLAVNEEEPMATFLDAMREEANGPLTGLFASSGDPDPRLASIGVKFVTEDGVCVSPSVDAPWFEEDDFEHGEGLYSRKTREFASNNDLDGSDISSQWEVVKEELKEMAEEFERAEPHLPDGEIAKGALGEEMADAVFTIHLLAHLAGINLRDAFREKADYNLEKSGQRDESGKIIDDAEVTDE
jgi:NTP pyrophosphatase (non-canonical NTP hydrolase)